MLEIVINAQTGEKTTREIPDITPSSEQLQMQYHELIVNMVREKYTADDETAIIRKKIAGIDINDEFTPYNTYVEDCKTTAHNVVYGGGV